MSDNSIDSLVNSFNHSLTVVWKPKQQFVADINVIINEMLKYQSYTNIDIYEVLVSCGHNLTWDVDYLVSEDDLNWLKNGEGKIYFFQALNKNYLLNNIYEYQAIIVIHSKLVELFCLQLEQ